MFMSTTVKIFSFGGEATAEWNGKFHLSPNENIFTIARMNRK
jgi:hypothetical protein